MGLLNNLNAGKMNIDYIKDELDELVKGGYTDKKNLNLIIDTANVAERLMNDLDTFEVMLKLLKEKGELQ